ncbi:PTS sugar transporter subunit IIA [Psittacicella hinzii]|uniref:PTS sugar transporter subunit IIA n=1 Tax=Psittacicella hinzii TaxID=2028575 RepID=UPI001FEA17F0|nr:PTS glucose transporter subunit IIA [Psittacicella hinzii]
MRFEKKIAVAQVKALEKGQECQLASPISGKVLPLDQGSDPGFASGAMGPGMVIQPSEGRVYAPVSGKVESLFPSKHALILQLDNGIQLLIHFGMDTVSLNGQGFTAHVQTGDRFNAGDLLLEADLEFIKSQGLSTETPIVITNFEDDDGEEQYAVVNVRSGDLAHNEPALVVAAK